MDSSNRRITFLHLPKFTKKRNQHKCGWIVYDERLSNSQTEAMFAFSHELTFYTAAKSMVQISTYDAFMEMKYVNQDFRSCERRGFNECVF